MANPMIKITDLTIRFDDEVIHKDFSLTVNKGEKIAITGESGTGKSTLLNAIVGFIPDYKGKIVIQDTVLSTDTASEIRKNIAWLPQDTSLNLETVENLFYAPFKFEVNKKQKPTKEEVSDILEKFELTEALLSKKVNEISGGQKQRIILASCLLLNKPLLLIDEPTSALDTAIKKKVTDYILSQDELTILAVTHDNYWMDKSDHIVEIK